MFDINKKNYKGKMSTNKIIKEARVEIVSDFLPYNIQKIDL
jgi:hypothetical protein